MLWVQNFTLDLMVLVMKPVGLMEDEFNSYRMLTNVCHFVRTVAERKVLNFEMWRNALPILTGLLAVSNHDQKQPMPVRDHLEILHNCRKNVWLFFRKGQTNMRRQYVHR